MHLWELSFLTVTGGECLLNDPGKSHVEDSAVFGPELSVWFTPSESSASCVAMVFI